MRYQYIGRTILCQLQRKNNGYGAEKLVQKYYCRKGHRYNQAAKYFQSGGICNYTSVANWFDL